MTDKVLEYRQKVYSDGFQAFLKGRETNPYAEGEEPFFIWEEGFRDAEAESYEMDLIDDFQNF